MEIFSRKKKIPVSAPRITITGLLQWAGGVKKLIRFHGLLIAAGSFFYSELITAGPCYCPD